MTRAATAAPSADASPWSVPPPRPAPDAGAADQFWLVHQAAATWSVVVAAQRVGALAALSDAAHDASSLAHACGIGERGAGVLLPALAALGLLRRTPDGRYSAMEEAAPLAQFVAATERLADDLRQDGHNGAAAGVEAPARAAAVYPDVVGYLARLFAGAAERAADLLAQEVPGARVLDLGAGAAPWSLALARRDPRCTVTAVDLPPVLAETRRSVVAAGVDEGRFTFVPGDLFGVRLERGAYDLAIVASVCHLFDEAANRRLLRGVFESLRPGGRVAVLEALPNERLDGPQDVLLYAVGLFQRTRHGRVYPFSTYVAWLRGAGFDGVAATGLVAAPPVSLVLARKPAGA